MGTKSGLTEKEIEVMNLIKLGHANKQVAIILQIGEQTIKNHVSVILNKLRASDRTHAVYLCMKKGIIH